MLEKSSALSDIKILDFSHLLAGPFATQILGDYGAEVFKIERIHVGDDFRRWNFFNKKVGNYSSASYMAWNRNKRSIALDIRKPEAKKIIYKMAENCDVVIQNFRPGVMAKRGYGYEDFSKINPKIIVVHPIILIFLSFSIKFVSTSKKPINITGIEEIRIL